MGKEKELIGTVYANIKNKNYFYINLSKVSAAQKKELLKLHTKKVKIKIMAHFETIEKYVDKK